MQPTQKTVTGVELTPADTLRLAALYLRRHGWTQGGYFLWTTTATPPACALGAIAMATYGTKVEDPFSRSHVDADVFRYATEVLRDHLELNVFGPPEHPGPDHMIPHWNDDYAASPDEVIETLEAAAREWDYFHGIQTAPDTATEDTSGGAE